ncbi:hypothetical protein RB598_009061 [Gaeumannomyces tritici]
MTSRLGPNPAPNPQRTPARPRPSTHTTAAAAAAAAPSRPITPTAGNATRVSGNGGDVPSLADTTLLNLDGSHARAGSSSDSDQTQTTPSHTETPPPPMNHILGIGSPQPSPLRLHFSAPLRSPGLFGGGGATSRFSDSFGSSNSPEGANGKTDDDDGDSDAPDDDVDDYDPTVVQESLDGHGSDDSDDDDDSDGDSHVSPAALRRKLVRVLEDQLVEVLAYLKTSAGARLETADFVVVQDQIDNVMDVFRRRGCPRLLVGPRPPRGAAAAPSRTVSIFKNMPLTPPRPRTPVHEALLDDGGDGSEAAAAAAAAAVGLVRRRRAERAAEKEADGQGGRARKQQSAGVVGRGSWSSSSCTTAASAGKQRPLSVGGGGGGAGLAASPMPPQAASTPTDVADLVVAEAEKLCLELAAVAKSLSDRRQDIYLTSLSREENVRMTESWSCCSASKSCEHHIPLPHHYKDKSLSLTHTKNDSEDEVRENESELFHIRLQLKAVELLSANSDGGGGGGGDVGHRGHHDPELVESIENFREDFEAVQERWRERRSCRGDGSTTTATGGGGGGGSSSSSFWSPLRQQQQQQGRRRRDTASYFTTPTRAGTSTGSEYLPSR